MHHDLVQLLSPDHGDREMRHLARELLHTLHGSGKGVRQPALRTVDQVYAGITEAKQVRDHMLWIWASIQAQSSQYTQRQWKDYWVDPTFTQTEMAAALPHWTEIFVQTGKIKTETKEKIRALEAQGSRAGKNKPIKLSAARLKCTSKTTSGPYR